MLYVLHTLVINVDMEYVSIEYVSIEYVLVKPLCLS